MYRSVMRVIFGRVPVLARWRELVALFVALVLLHMLILGYYAVHMLAGGGVLAWACASVYLLLLVQFRALLVGRYTDGDSVPPGCVRVPVGLSVERAEELLFAVVSLSQADEAHQVADRV